MKAHFYRDFFGGFSVLRKNRSRGFTLIEICFVVLLLGVIMIFSMTALATARTDALDTRASAAVLQLNQAATRARIKGEVSVGTFGNDAPAAMAWYVSNGYIRQEVDLFGVSFIDGQWEKDLPW